MSDPFKTIAKRDAQGFIMTGIDFQTSTEGIFAAGDVRSGSTKQLVSAAGEGAAAALRDTKRIKYPMKQTWCKKYPQTIVQDRSSAAHAFPLRPWPASSSIPRCDRWW